MCIELGNMVAVIMVTNWEYEENSLLVTRSKCTTLNGANLSPKLSDMI